MNRSSRLASRAPLSSVRSISLAAMEAVEARRLLASVSGVVFNDSNADGVRQSSEAGLNFEVVYADRNNNGLYDGTDVATRTDVNGRYTLASLPADGAPITIRVRGDTGKRVVLPAGNGYAVKLTAASPDLVGKDFAVGPTVRSFDAVQGYVYADVDKSGTITTGDLFGAGATVFADLNGNGAADAGEPTTAADQAGSYVLQNVPATGAPVTFVAIVDGARRGTATYAIAHVDGTHLRLNITYAPPTTVATIAGIVYRDDNGNGKVDGQDTLGLGDEVVYLDRNRNGIYDGNDVATRTTPNGHYAFGNVAIDGSTVAVRLRGINAPRTVTAPTGGAYVLTLNASAATTGLNFSVAPGTAATPKTTTVSGTAYVDGNGNGKLDAGEPGLTGYFGEGVLYADLNRDGVRQSGEPTAHLDSAGQYTLANVPTNATLDVRFAENSPALLGLYQDSPAGFCAPRTLTTGAAPVIGADFGFEQANALNAIAFVDVNGNGKQDAGETEVPGVIWIDLNNNGRRDANEPLVPGPDTFGDGPGDRYQPLGVPVDATYVIAYSRNTAPNAPADVTTTINTGVTQQVRLAVKPVATIVSGKVFNDANANGYFDAGDSFRASEVVYIDRNNNGIYDGNDLATRTDQDGAFRFATLPADGAAATVRLRGVPASRITAPATGGFAVTFNGTTFDGLSFGVKPAPTA